MVSVCLNEILPADKRIKKVYTGSELLFIYELDKYAKLLLGKSLSLRNVSVIKSIRKNEYFSFVVSQGLDMGFVVDREELVDYKNKVGLFFTGSVEGVVFKSVTPELYVYDFHHNVQANLVAHGANRSAAYVSMVAYIMVKSIKDGVACPKLVIDHRQHAQMELEYMDLLILKNYGNALIEDMVDIQYADGVKQQPEWEAFVGVNRQSGRMNREYSVGDKYKLLKKSFAAGDVVLLYRRSKGKTINRLESCYPAVITNFDKECLKLKYYPVVETKITRNITLDSMEDEVDNLQLTSHDRDRFTECKETFQLEDIGVDSHTYLERVFILKPMDFDGTHQVFKTKDGYEKLFVSTLDTIYAVFEDRGVVYNKERFLNEHFTPFDRVPVYDKMTLMGNSHR